MTPLEQAAMAFVTAETAYIDAGNCGAPTKALLNLHDALAAAREEMHDAARAYWRDTFDGDTTLTGKRKAPWPDFAGKEIHEGDTIRHPAGDTGIVVYDPSRKDAQTRWRVDYGDESLWLGNQIGDRGRAVVIEAP